MKKLIKSSRNIDEVISDKVWEIADRYNTSRPVSGDWATEIVHEQRAIAEELGISMREAKQLMIDELGFEEDHFVKASKSIRNRRRIVASSANDYTDHYFKKLNRHKFSVYTKYNDDADNFQCVIEEVHPYDEGEYYWIKKNMPSAAMLIKGSKRVGYIELREWDDDAYEEYNGNEKAFIKDLVDYMCEELIGYNKNVKSQMSYD